MMASSTGNSDLAEDGRSVDGRPTGVVSNRKGGGGGSVRVVKVCSRSALWRFPLDLKRRWLLLELTAKAVRVRR